MKKILILHGSPKKDGNTSALINWFIEGTKENKAEVEVIHTAFLKYKSNGCTSCRACQKSDKYECVIDDDAKEVLIKMGNADVIVMATPLYFYTPSAQLKTIIDRMFSLYKWDNSANTFTTPLKGKPMVLLASAYEDVGLDVLEKSFKLTAQYTGMPFYSLLIKNAGVSGEIINKKDSKEKAVSLGKRFR